MVIILVVYDISDDRVRSLVSNKLLAMGFNRLQRSAYVRRGTSGTARYVFRFIKSLINSSTDKLLVIPLPNRVYESSLTIGPKYLGGCNASRLIL